MAKYKTQKRIVGSNNIVRTAIPKEMYDWIIEFRVELNSNSKKKVSNQWAALQLTKKFRDKTK